MYVIRNISFMKTLNFLQALDQELQHRNYSLRTKKIYMYCVLSFLKYVKDDITQCNRQKIIEFILFLQKQGKAPKTLNLHKEALKFFCKEVLRQPMALDIKLSKEPKKLPVVLSRQEIAKILEATKNEKHKILLALSYGAGLRVSEVVNLRVRDINLDELTLSIRGAKGQKDRITVFPEKLQNAFHYLLEGKKAQDYVFSNA